MQMQNASLLAVMVILATSLSPLKAAAPESKSTAPKPASDSAQKYSATGTVTFSGTSTLHDFSGQVNIQPFTLKIQPGNSSKDPGTMSGESTVKVGEMVTGDSKRDRNMWEMLGMDSHPLIRGKVTNAKIPASGSSSARVSLRIRDEEHQLPVTISEWNSTKNEITFRVTGQGSLSQFNLSPPSVLGVIRVGDTVTVDAQFRAVKTGTTSPRGSR